METELCDLVLDEYTGTVVVADADADRIVTEGTFPAETQFALRPGHRVVVLPADLAEEMLAIAESAGGCDCP